MNNYGLGAGIAQGLQTFQQGLVQADNIKNNRQLIQMQAEMHSKQMQAMDISSNMAMLQVEKLQKELEDIKTSRTKDIVFNSIRGYIATSDITYLNNALKDPSIRDLLEGRGIIGFESPATLSAETLDKIGYTQAKDNSIYPVIVVDTDGNKKVVDLYGTLLASGYANIMSESEKRDLDLKMQNLQVRSIEATAQQNEINLNLLKKWADKNPNATIVDFLNAQKPSDTNASEALSAMKLEGAMVEDVAIQNTDEVLSQLDSDSNTIVVGGYAVNKYKAAKALQGDAKPGTEDTNYIDGLYDASKQMQGLYKKFESIDRNAITTGMDKVSKILGVGWASKTPEEQIKDLNRIQIDSELRTIIAGYIKTMSGAAVTNEERKLFYDTILGGNWSNKDEAMATMRGFISSVNSTLSSRLNSYKDRFPFTYLREKDRLKKVMEFKEGEKPNSDKQVSRAPQPGSVVNGYQFKGGNPKDPNNWIKVK